MEYRQFEAPDLLLYFTREEAEQLGLDGYKIDTFSSDYDEFVDEFGTEFEAHGASVGSVHGRPSWGHFVICNLRRSDSKYCVTNSVDGRRSANLQTALVTWYASASTSDLLC
jgi:hypothetical protein